MEISSMDESYGGKPRKYLVPVVFDKEESKRTSEESSTTMEGVESFEVTEAQSKDLINYACIIGSEDSHLEDSLKSLNFSICYSSDGRHLPDYVPDGCNIVFVCPEFNGKVFDYLLKQKYRIVGPPCVKFCAKNNIPLLDRKRPVYCCMMNGVVACLTGFKADKELARELCDMIHWMGGSVRNKVSSAVTHVIAKNVVGANYKNAVSFGNDIMSKEWVYKSWDCRNDINFIATDSTMMIYKQLPFLGCHISLFGFSDTEAKHVTEIAQANGCVMCELNDDELTHVVVANGVDTTNIPISLPSRTHIVKQQWFWESIQIEACADEAVYYAKERQRKRHSIHNTSIISMDSLLEASLVSLSSPISRQGYKSDVIKKPSSLTTSNSSSTPNESTNICTAAPTSKEELARYHIVSELLQTETNFVKILNLIIKEFKIPLEQPSQRGGPLLSHENIKSIFGNIPDILTVHTKIMAGLEQHIAQWTSESCIGNILLEQSEELLRVYPPFVNYFEITKECLLNCDKQFPRFHAFLKYNESRPDCGRQTLAELLITPVQRIPRIILLLQDLLKHTDSSHPDLEPLQKAVDSLKTVMNHINEDKRKTEGQMHMFEMVREIEDVPANLLSSHRSFVSQFDVVELSAPATRNSKALSVALFLFSDSIEIAKIRSGHGFSAMKGPYKPYRHLEFLTYTNIRSIVDFTDNEDVTNGFGLLVHWLDDPQERLLTFRVTGDNEVKTNLLTQLSQLIADNNCTTIPDDFIWRTSADILQSMCKGQTGDSNTLKRALTDGFKGMRKKVKRTISNRSSRRPFTPISKNIEALDPMDESFTECDTTHDTSIASIAVTPVSTLRAPPAKRLALGRSFSTLDLTKI